MMVQVVRATAPGTGAQIPGITVAGKTGTAQIDAGHRAPRVVRRLRAGRAPAYAVSVIVEHGGDGRRARGHRWRDRGADRQAGAAKRCSACDRRTAEELAEHDL